MWVTGGGEWGHVDHPPSYTVRRRFNRPYWSLSASLKVKTKRAVQHIGRFEEAVVTEARNWEVDGVVCGHIHHAELRTIDGTLYANTGD